MNNLLTINTDASHAPNTTFGAYAFWIVTDEGKIQKAGELKGETLTSVHAEMKSICNAIHAFKYSKFRGIKKVVVNSDCQNVINCFQFKQLKMDAKLKEIFNETRFLMMECCIIQGLSIRKVDEFFVFKHVKAHNGKKDSRSFVNDWCDKNAKLYLKKLISKNGNKR